MDRQEIVERVKDWYREGHRMWYYVLLNGNSISFILPPSYHESNEQGQISDRIIGSIGIVEIDSVSFLNFQCFMVKKI